MTNSSLAFELVLPCYNEAKSLEAIVTRASAAATAAGYDAARFRIVLVENGSRDDSRAVLDELAKGPLSQWFRRVDVDVNEGYGHGLWQGLQSTTAPVVGWSHADQQCDPADAFRALALLLNNGTQRHLIKGVRYGRNLKDKAVSRVFESFAWGLLGLRCPELNAQPKVFPRELLGELTSPPKTFAFDLYVLFRAVKAGYRIGTIDVEFPPRIHGVSNWAANFAGRRKTIAAMIRYMATLAVRDGRV